MNKKMGKDMKQRVMILAVAISLFLVSGCGEQSAAVDRKDTNMTQMSETEPLDMDKIDINMTQASEKEAAAEEENVTQMSQSQNGSAMKETEDRTFFFGKTYIYFVDKASDRAEVLWKNDAYEPHYTVFDGCGVILGKRMYFIEAAAYKENGISGVDFVLSAINTDGTGYEQAVSGPAAVDFYNIYYSGNRLYVYNDNCDAQCYQVLADGSLGEQIPQDETAFRYVRNLGEDYRLLHNGVERGNFLSPVESIEKYGSLIMQKNTSYVKIDMESGSEEWINFASPEYMEDGKAFYIGRQSDTWKLECFDLNTKEVTAICDIKGTGMIRTAYADGVFYYMTSQDNKNTTVGCISVAEGTGKVLFECHDTTGYVNGFSPTNFGLRVSGNTLYYMDMRDYDAYLIRVDLDDMQQTPLEAPIYRTGINKVGELAWEHCDIYKENNPRFLIGTANFNWLVIDDSFAGAGKINDYLYQREVADIRPVFENDVRRDGELLDTSSAPYSYDSEVACIQYFDGKYVSFVQEGYSYFGGAHGLPSWEGYVFDLETGKRLLLPDLVSNTEEELKDIVTQYFSEKIDECPDEYWQDAKETVRECVSMEMTDFVLTDEGIRFFMHPYSISAYAAGFPEVTVPYAEFRGLPLTDKMQ